MKNKYLTECERYQIEILYKEKYEVKEIAVKLGRCKATIYNELKRGMVSFRDSEYREVKTYDAYYAHQEYLKNSKEKGRPLKVANDLGFIKFCERLMLDEKFSPVALIARIKNENLSFKTDVCFKTLYNYVKSGVFLNVSMKELPYHKTDKKKACAKSKVCLHNVKGTSIEKRPHYINLRDEFGHWEMDTVVSGHGKGKSCLLVLTERMTRFELIRKIPDKSSASVVKAIDLIEKDIGTGMFRFIFKTITCDNGTEFLNFNLLESSVLCDEKRCDLYYCHPYSSFERGSNENCNKLIRRFVPKGCDISKYTDEYIMYVQNWINIYPRKLFDFLSSRDMLFSALKKFGHANFFLS